MRRVCAADAPDAHGDPSPCAGPTRAVRGYASAVRVLACLPAVLIAALIWWLSSTPDLAVAAGALDTVLRKAAHIGIFAALALACVLALRANGVRAAAAIAIGALIALGYAAVDELHQSTVPTRNGAVSDVMIDAFGVGLASLALARRARRPVPC